MPYRPALLALLLSVIVCVAPSVAQAADTVDLIVRRDAGLGAAERADVRSDAGVDLERRLRLPDAEVVSVPAGDAAGALRELNGDPDVRWAVRDGATHADAVTGSDSYWSYLWALQNTGQTLSVGGVSYPGIADADMDVPGAWAQSTGAGVTVAVVDTGVQFDHPDLSSQFATNPGETGTDGFGIDKRFNGDDDDGNGLVDDWRGWDFAAGDNDPSDVKGHGTHVAGIVAAVNGNHLGSTGVAPDAKVLSLRALGDDGTGSWSAAGDAFDLAGDMGIRVVNASLGGAGAAPYVTEAITAHPNTLYVVSAGNDTLDLESNTYYPCEVPAANVVCVGASDNRDVIADFSNYGTTAVDLFAPGVNILSSYKGSSYVWMGGTSMAAPNVAAVAALLLSRNPTLTAAQVKDALMGTVDPVSGLPSVSGGRVNAEQALLSVPADRDADGIADQADNCPAVSNSGQADADGDGAGDACDSTPRGHDNDGDGIPALDDGCPDRPGPASDNGCPAADETPVDPSQDPGGSTGSQPAAPIVSRVTVRLSRCSRPGHACRRRAQVRTTASTGATVTVVVERATRHNVWVKLASGRAAGAATKVNIRKPLAAGSYRVTVTAAAAGRTSVPKRTTFRVRG